MLCRQLVLLQFGTMYLQILLASMTWTTWVHLVSAAEFADPSSSEFSNVEIQTAFVKWVDGMASVSHSRFGAPQNEIQQKNIKVVDILGRGDYTTIQAAVDSVDEGNQQRVVIRILAGFFWEKVRVPLTKPFITFEGDDVSGATTILWGDTASSLGADGTPLGTFKSATVTVDSDYFIAQNITFKNVALPPLPGAVGAQAVALRISGDNAAFYNCQFLGAQDTLYDHRGRHYFEDCFIEGSVDFIFGDGLSYYQSCHLHAIAVVQGSLTAQKRSSKAEDTGFSFVNCSVTGSGSMYLGRAWGNFSRVVYANSFMDDIILPQGWSDWNDTSRDDTVFYGEYKCYGPGASQNSRVPWSRRLSKSQAKPFLSVKFIDGAKWLPHLLAHSQKPGI